MPLTRKTTRFVTRMLYAGNFEQVHLLKRNDDQQQGTVRKICMFSCRRSMISKTGQPIQGDNTAMHTTVWHIPRRELDRVGVAYLSALDRIVQVEGAEAGSTWQPESTTPIDVKLFSNEVDLHCLRTDPPVE